VTNHSDISEGYKATELGALPKEWDIDRLGNIAEIQVGYSFSSAEFLEQETIDSIPIIRIRDLVSGNPGTFIKFPKELSIYQDFLVNPFDILIGMDGNFHTVRWSGTPGLLNQRISRVRILNQNANDDFIFYFIINPIKEIEHSKHFTTVKHLSNKDLKNLPIPLPPLPEQHAIAITLRTVQEAKEKTDAIIAATKALKVAMMKHLFTYGPVPPEDAEKVALKETEIGQVPEEWDLQPLGNISKISSGGTPSRTVPSYWNGEIPWIRTGESTKMLEIQ
jgi:type I restriction enzyme, S subunit